MSAYAAFVSRNYRCLLAGTTLSNLAGQMLGVVVGWDLYQATRSPIVLGNVGLAQIVPVFLFTFSAGSVADRYDCRTTTVLMQSLVAVVGFALAAAGANRGVPAIDAVLFLDRDGARVPVAGQPGPPATDRAPDSPDQRHLVVGTGRELATVGGPALAGILLAAFGSESVYLAQAVCSVAAVACYFALSVPPPAPAAPGAATGWRGALEGLRFVWREKLVLGAMSLDMLAVFFGGAIALLPIFASEILTWALMVWAGPRGPGHRRRRDVGVAGASAHHSEGRPGPAVLGRVLRGRHDRVRAVDSGVAVVPDARADGRLRCRQCGVAHLAALRARHARYPCGRRSAERNDPRVVESSRSVMATTPGPWAMS